jgi:hypothetical protein
MNQKLIPNKNPCRNPEIMNSPHALHPPGPSRTAKLAAKTKLPGVWMHIMGTDKLPVSCNRHVIMICGIYCMAASADEEGDGNCENNDGFFPRGHLGVLLVEFGRLGVAWKEDEEEEHATTR